MNDFLQSLRNGQADKPRAPKTRKNYDNSYQYSNNPRYHSYGSGYQNPRTPNMKRQPLPPGPMGNQLPPEDPGIALLADAIENLTHHVEILVKNQEYLTTVQERTADMLERQAFAIERIVAHLSIDAPPRTDSGPAPETCRKTVQETDIPLEQVVEATAETRGNLFPEDVPAAPVAPEPKTRHRVIRKRKKPMDVKKQRQKVLDNATLLPREEIMDIIQTMREKDATYDQIARHLIELGQPTFSGRGEWHAQTIHRLCSKK
jgi:hypothetical protein